MDENSTEIKIDHHNGPDPEVEKRLEEESAAALPQKDSAPEPAETADGSTKKANILTVAIVVVLFLIALAVVGAVLAVRYFGK